MGVCKMTLTRLGEVVEWGSVLLVVECTTERQRLVHMLKNIHFRAELLSTSWAPNSLGFVMICFGSWHIQQ